MLSGEDASERNMTSPMVLKPRNAVPTRADLRILYQVARRASQRTAADSSTNGRAEPGRDRRRVAEGSQSS